MNSVGKVVRKAVRLQYSCMNAVAPYMLQRWVITGGLLLAYLISSQHPGSDITTYLIGFYLLLVAINYFIPKGLDEDEEEEDLYSLHSLDDSLSAFSFTA